MSLDQLHASTRVHNSDNLKVNTIVVKPLSFLSRIDRAALLEVTRNKMALSFAKGEANILKKYC